MSQRTVVLDLEGDHQLARDLVAGGVFVPDVLRLGEDCALVLRNGDELLELHAMCVFVDASKGSGLQLVGCNGDMKQRIVALASGMNMSSEPDRVAFEDIADDDTVGELQRAGDHELRGELQRAGDHDPGADDDPDAGYDPGADDPGAGYDQDADRGPHPEDEPGAGAVAADASEATTDGEPADDDEDGNAERKIALNVHERLRGLTVVQQLKIAQKGEVSERTVLERLYGKNVWEALLRNPRITGPEIARISRMGALPRPLIELIVGNGGWLQIPEVRRALLSNPRLGMDQILRVLRLLPKHELKLAGIQTAYPVAVRDAAKRMLREMGG
ncbi:MAG TPA: hypothetical protein VIV11_03455 [Kofleriaceae bacterium]